MLRESGSGWRPGGIREWLKAGAIAGAVFLVPGCGESPTPITTCEPSAEIDVQCGFRNPEDLVAAPGGGRLIVSQMGAMDGSRPGNLVLYEPEGGVRVLFPGEFAASGSSRGDAGCPPPDPAAFSPHGMDLVQGADGGWMLLVVNHGGRESVEFFAVSDEGQELGLSWQGCALGPEGSAFNDVVGLEDGSFYVTHMFPADSQWSAMIRGALLGSDTGFVYRWDPNGGWSRVPGSEGPFPNGIEIAPDGSALYINMYLAGEVRKLDLASGEIVAVAEGGNPDNSTWAPDGRLLVATHTDGILESMACQDLEQGSCGFAFRVVALDPDTLASETVAAHRGAPMGGVTVALEMDGRLFLGTFAGDRIASLAWPPE